MGLKANPSLTRPSPQTPSSGGTEGTIPPVQTNGTVKPANQTKGASWDSGPTNQTGMGNLKCGKISLGK